MGLCGIVAVMVWLAMECIYEFVQDVYKEKSVPQRIKKRSMRINLINIFKGALYLFIITGIIKIYFEVFDIWTWINQLINYLKLL